MGAACKADAPQLYSLAAQSHREAAKSLPHLTLTLLAKGCLIFFLPVSSQGPLARNTVPSGHLCPVFGHWAVFPPRHAKVSLGGSS